MRHGDRFPSAAHGALGSMTILLSINQYSTRASRLREHYCEVTSRGILVIGHADGISSGVRVTAGSGKKPVSTMLSLCLSDGARSAAISGGRNTAPMMTRGRVMRVRTEACNFDVRYANLLDARYTTVDDGTAIRNGHLSLNVIHTEFFFFYA